MYQGTIQEIFDETVENSRQKSDSFVLNGERVRFLDGKVISISSDAIDAEMLVSLKGGKRFRYRDEFFSSNEEFLKRVEEDFARREEEEIPIQVRFDAAISKSRTSGYDSFVLNGERVRFIDGRLMNITNDAIDADLTYYYPQYRYRGRIKRLDDFLEELEIETISDLQYEAFKKIIKRYKKYATFTGQLKEGEYALCIRPEFANSRRPRRCASLDYLSRDVFILVFDSLEKAREIREQIRRRAYKHDYDRYLSAFGTIHSCDKEWIV